MAIHLLPVQRVTRYNLIISFEEPYTRDDLQLQASADAIGDIIGAMETLLRTDTNIQAMLAEQHLTISTVAPARVLPETHASLPQCAEAALYAE